MPPHCHKLYTNNVKGICKYFHVIYEQLAFTVTAVLYQEQVLNHYVDIESERLNTIREGAYARGLPFSSFVDQALASSSIARSMRPTCSRM